MPDYKDHKKWGCPKYRDWQPNQTYDVRITEENLPDRPSLFQPNVPKIDR